MTTTPEETAPTEQVEYSQDLIERAREICAQSCEGMDDPLLNADAPMFRAGKFDDSPYLKICCDALLSTTRPAADPAKDVEGLVNRLQSKAKELLEHRHATAGWLMQEAAQSTAAQSQLIGELRLLVAKLYTASGCSCCRDEDEWEAASNQLGELLDIPKYSDGSGYDFYSIADAKAQAWREGK